MIGKQIRHRAQYLFLGLDRDARNPMLRSRTAQKEGKTNEKMYCAQLAQQKVVKFS